MALTNAQLKADQAQVFSDFPTETITISGSSYNCLVLNYRTGVEWQSDGGGYLDNVEASVAIERSAINDSIPEQGTLATFRDISMRIGRVDYDDAAASVVLELTKPTT